MHVKSALPVLFCAFLITTTASAATDFRVLVDLDNDASTGCSVNGMAGVDRVITTTYDSSGSSPRVTSVTRQDCSGTSLSSVVTIDATGWPATTNASTGVSIIETSIPLSAFGSPMPHIMRLGFVMVSGSDTVTVLADADGNPILFPNAATKPHIVGRASRAFVADGLTGDWDGIPALVNGDASEANTFRLLNVFAFLTNQSAFFRFDEQSHPAAPTARNDTYNTPRNTPLIVTGPGVLANDTDPNSKPLTAIQLTSPNRGAVVLNADGSFTYTPDGDEPARATFFYQASNGTQRSNVARVEIRVGQTNHAPNAGDDNYNVVPGGTINAPAPGVLANDNDPDGDALHAVLRTAPIRGTVTLNPDGSFVYVNNGGLLADDSFTYVASDGIDVSREATVHIHVGTNDVPPVAVDDNYTVDEGGTLTVGAPGVLGNDHDSDTPSNQLTAQLRLSPAHGTVTLLSDGSFTYTHDGSETTSDIFTYRVYDRQLFSNTATVHITINPVNDAPTAVADAYSTLANTTLNVAAPGVLANDTDPDSPPASLTAQLVTTAANGALTLNANGSFTYIPNANFFGTDSFTYRTSDGLLQSAPATVTITVDKIPAITSPNNVTFTIGIFNTFNVTTSGQPAPSIAESGALPVGVTFVDGTGTNKGTGVLSGTPGAGTAGIYNITFNATNPHGSSGPQAFTLTVVCPTIIVTNPASATAPAGAAFTRTFTQSGGVGAVTFTTASTLPAGLALATNGTLSGTPTQTGTFPITVQVTDSNGCSANGAVYNLVITCQTITVTNPATATGTVSTPFSQQFTQSGAIGATTFTTASTLPAGLLLATNGTLSGTPAQTGTFPIAVTVTDANGCTGTSAVYNLIINCQTITVTNPATATGTASTPFSQAFTQTGAIGAATFTTASTLPAGLTLATNGTLSGTPTQTGTFPITVTVTDSNGCTGTSAVYNLVIGCQTITVSNPATTTGTAASPFSQTFTQTGAIGTATFTTTSTLPAGLTLATNGTLSGTPTQTGSFPIIITVTDGNGCTGSGATYTLVIGCQTITVTNPAVGGATANTPFSVAFTQSGAIGTATFTTTSTLPAGLTLATNGTLSGTPLQTGSFPVVVTVTDSNGCTGVSGTYDLGVSCQVITVVNPSTTTGTVQAPFSQTFTATNTIGATTFTTASTLPAGLTLATDGTLSGTPTQTGSFPIVVDVTDGNGCPGSGPTYTLVIGCQTITVTNPANANGTVSTPFSEQFSQTGATGTATFTTASTLPAGLTLSTSGLLSGTPTQNGTFPIDVLVTDSNGCTGTSATYNLVIGCQTITVNNPATTSSPAGTPLSINFTQSGAVGGATFTTSSTLPTGLSLATDGTLSGTPTQGGVFPIVVTVTDGNGCTGTNPPYSLTITCPTITVTNPVVNSGTVGAAFSQTFTQSGGQGAITFTTTSTLPGGLNLAANGTLSGTPSQFGSFPIVVTATDQNGCTGTGSTYTLVISCPTITVTNPATTTGTAGTPFSQTFSQSGGFGTVTFTTSSTLPNGLLLSAAGVLSGTPTQTGSFSIVVTATDAAGCTGVGPTYNLVIGCQTINVTNPATTTGTVLTPFSQTFTQSGAIGGATFTTTSTLPNGLTLATDGTLSGTPMQPGPFPIVVKVTDSNGCTGTGTTYNLFVFCQAIPITPPPNTTGTVGTFYSGTFTASNTIGTQTWSTASTLPTGITLDSSTGVLSGTPTQSGSFLINISVKDSNNCQSVRSFTLVISCQTITVSNPGTNTGTVGTPFSLAFTQTGAIGTATFTTASTLPGGLSLAADGTLSGTPTQSGTFPIVVTVTDSNGCTGTGATYTLVITCNVITVTNPATSTGTVDTPFSQTFTQSGGNGTLTFTLNSGSLPSGLTLSTAGVLSGTPTAAGSFTITVKATDSNGCTGIGPTYTLVIGCQTIIVTNPATTTGTVDAPFNQSFTQTGVGTHTPALFTLNSGSLPAGLTLSAAGVLSGTPTQPGSFPITVKVTDANGCTGIGATYTLVIACQTITVTNPVPNTGTFNAAFSQTFTQTGVGTHTPATFTINSGTLPTGLSLSAAGVLSGTPTQTGTFPITIKVTDSNGCTGIGGTYNLAINPLVTNDAYGTVNALVDNTQAYVTGGATAAPGTPAVQLSGSLTSNDLPAGGVSVTAGTFATGQGGSVTIAADGTFLYTPAVHAAAITSDSFTYTATSNTGGTATPTTANGTVTLTLAGRVWYVKNNGGGTNGQSQSPFATLAQAGTASTATDIIFVYNGDGSNSGQNAGISLKSGQQLLGEINGLTVNAQALVAIGARPTIGNSGGDGVTVSATAGSLTGVLIKGLSIAGTANGINLSSSGANLLIATVDNVVITGATANNGIKIAGASTATTTVTVQNSTVSAATQNGIDAQQTSAGNLVLNINNNTVTANGTGINVNGAGSTSTDITNFANNAISGNTVGNGITVTSATFDAAPGGAFQTVSGGTTVIGASGNGVGASGMVLTNVSGDLSFTDLDIFTSAGAGLRASGTTPYTGSAGFQINAGAGVASITAVGGPAVDLNVVKGNGLSFTMVSSTTSPTTGVALNSFLGSFSAGSGSAISGVTSAAGTSFQVGSSNATITYDGTITNTTGKGVDLTNNTGSTISFTGLLTLSSVANNAFNASGGGTVTTTNISSTLTTTTGTALTVTNTTIGAAGMFFRSVSTNGGPNGIFLNNTGTSAGLTINGDGANTSVGGNSTGGTIQNTVGANGATTGSGIYLNNTKNVVLRRMTITGTNQNFGIRGFLVNGFTLEYSTVSGTNGGNNNAFPDDSGEGSIYFGNTATNGLSTQGTFTNNSISGGAWDNMHVENTAAGTTTLTVKGNTFGLNGTINGNQSFLVVARNNGTVVNSVVGGPAAGEANTFTGAPGGLANFTGQQGTTMDVQFKNNVMSNSHPNNNVGGGCLTLASAGTMTFVVDSNSMRGADGSTITLQKADPSPNNTISTSLSGRLTNNTLGVSGIVDSASKSGNGIFLSAAGKGTIGLTITGNNITNWHGNAAMFFDNTGGSYAANFTIQNNTMAQPGAGSFATLAVTNGGNLTSDTVNVCATIGGAGVLKNTFSGAAGVADVYLGSSGQNGGHTFNLPGYVGASNLANVAAFVTGNNTLIGGATVTAYDDNGGQGSFTGVGGSCPTP